MKKPALALLIVPVIFFLVLSAGSCSFNKGGTRVSVDTVINREIIETVTASGKIQPETEVKVSSDVSGQIIELLVKEGDSVQKGQLLLVVNPDLYQSEFDRMQAVLNNSKASLAGAEARLEQVKAQLLKSEQDYNRNKILKDKNAISTAEWQSIETQYEVAKSEVKSAEKSVLAADYSVKSTQASVNAARDNLKRTQIFAPMPGIVCNMAVEQGDRIVGTAQMAGTEMFRIADLSQLEVNVEVNENDIVKIDLGDTALIEVDAYLGRKFKGIVTQIANSAKSATQGLSSDEVTNFEVKIRILRDSYADLLEGLPSNASPFRPGMSATVEIHTAYNPNAVSVPIQSVTARSPEEEITENGEKEPVQAEDVKQYVFVLEDKTVKMVEVETGIQDNRYIEITKGLTTGQQVIEGPYKAVSETLKDGDKVKVTPKEELYKSGK